jgi:hypothetical protein
MRTPTDAVLAAIACTALAAGGAFAEEVDDPDNIAEPGKTPFFSRLQNPLRLSERIEAMPQGPAEPLEYDRRLPLFGRELAKKGYALPLPIGVTVLINNTLQPQEISNAAVALGKGEFVPPPGTELRELPYVDFTGVEADSLSTQVKLDAWLFPFLNVYGIVGYFRSDVDLIVEADLDEAFPPPICGPLDPCGTVAQPFKAEASGYSYGAGFSAAYGAEPWFGAINFTYVYNDGRNGDDRIISQSAGARTGRYWNISESLLLSAYVGADYLNVDQTVNGTTRLPDAFPDGDDLNVRYRIDQDNTDKWSGLVGMTFGLKRGIGVIAEAAFGEDSHRFMASAYYRF